MNKVIPRIALVTGGNRGIGMEIARQLSLKGIKVLIGCRNEGKGRNAVKQLSNSGVSVELEVVDVNSNDSIARMMKGLKKNTAVLIYS